MFRKYFTQIKLYCIPFWGSRPRSFMVSTIIGCISGCTGYTCIKDFNRKIDICDDFIQKDEKEVSLRWKLEYMYSLSNKHKLQYGSIVMNKNSCKELNHIYKSIKNDIEFEIHDTKKDITSEKKDKIEKELINRNSREIKLIIRRGFIKNGYIDLWISAIFNEYVSKIFILPLLKSTIKFFEF